jgi:hypothetical protein
MSSLAKIYMKLNLVSYIVRDLYKEAKYDEET